MRPTAILVLTIAICSQTRAAEPFSAEDVQFFESKVRPLLVERCHRCHSTEAKKQRGKLLLDSRPAILKGGASGPAAVPREPDRSRILEAVHYQTESLQMPPNGKLPDREVAVLEEWVRRGLPFPETAAQPIANKTIDIAAGRKFWSFQPPRSIDPPAVREKSWPSQRIDHFLLGEMEKHGLSPSPLASRRTLIRRAYFDLVGLPPTPEEVEAFVNDKSADAYGKLIDTLLSSPHYGERWGRYWLDVVRYCDVAEAWADCKGAAWLYRDWVVKVMNDDMPYDRFVQMQLAADLMPSAKPPDRAALGFLGLAPTYWKELKLDKDVIKTVVAEEWEEHVQTLGGAFLGLTIGCARCHDHKFDPIPQTDYYALAGVFASIRQVDRAILPDADAEKAHKARERVKVIQVQLAALQMKKPIPAEDMAKIAEMEKEIVELRKTPHFDTPLVPAVEESSLRVLPDGEHRTKLEHKPGVATDVAVQVRGNPTNLGPVVPRRFLTVLAPVSPQPFREGSGRLELAKAITTEGAPLAARVIVNRVWADHFGRGLIDTPSDLGSQGTRPSHPELLDDLTARFIAKGWSIKWLHREIMLSSAYQQSSMHDAKKASIDTDNRWLWRMNRRRLDVEAWRDAMLTVNGTLKRDLGGPSQELSDAKNVRRTIYGTVKRRELSDMLRLYDFPDPTVHSASRIPTTTPLQQLFVLNSPFMQQQASALAARLKTEAPASVEARVQRAYQLLYGRTATDKQLKFAIEFLGDGKSDARWQQYAQALLMSNEFAFID